MSSSQVNPVTASFCLAVMVVPGLACVSPRLAESTEIDKSKNGIDYPASGFVGLAEILNYMTSVF